MGKRTIAQAARNIVARQNVRVSIQEFQAFVSERTQQNSENKTENKAPQQNSASEKK